MEERERKRIERETYNGLRQQGRPAFSSFWEPELYRAMFDAELNPALDRWGQRYLQGKRVLILGAGSAEMAFASQFGAKVTALNISDKAIDGMRPRYPHAEYLVGDAERLSFEAAFDVVLCKAILHHLQPFDEVVARIAAALVPGGYLFVMQEPGRYNPFAVLGRRFTPSSSHTPGEQPFVFSRFQRALGRHFETVEDGHHFLISMMLPIAARRAPQLKPICKLLLGPTLTVEKALLKAPGASELFWITAGVYRRNDLID